MTVDILLETSFVDCLVRILSSVPIALTVLIGAENFVKAKVTYL